MSYLVAPNGKRINRTLETILADCRIIDCEPREGGGFDLQYGDDGTEICWDSAEQVMRFAEGGTKPEGVYLDVDGGEWLESQLTLVEEADDAA